MTEPPHDQATLLRALRIRELHFRSIVRADLGRSLDATGSVSQLCGIVAARLLAERIGEVESPARSNAGPVVEELRRWAGEPIGDSPGPWCAYAVAGAQREAVRRVAGDLRLTLRLVSPTSGSTNRWWDKGIAAGIAVRADQWHVSPPPAGAAILRVGSKSDRGGRERDEVWEGGDGDSGHTLACAYLDATWVVSVEGNTSSGEQDRDGDGVWSHVYPTTHPRLIGHVPLRVAIG